MATYIDRILIDTEGGFVEILGSVDGVHCGSRVQADTFLAVPDEERRNYAQRELEIAVMPVHLEAETVMLLNDYIEPTPASVNAARSVRTLEELNEAIRAEREKNKAAEEGIRRVRTD